jgi:hypothetical protein
MGPPIALPKAGALVARLPALKRGSWSLLIPGLGQWLQHRQITAAIHFSTVLVAALGARSPVAIGLAIAARLWSAWEAYHHEDRVPSAQPNEEPV